MPGGFVRAEEIAADQQISIEEAEQLMKWLASEARIDGVCILERPVRVPKSFYEKMAERGYTPEGTRRMVSLEYLCRYMGLGQDRARALARRENWGIRVGRNVKYDMQLVDQWIDKKHEERRRLHGGG